MAPELHRHLSEGVWLGPHLLLVSVMRVVDTVHIDLLGSHKHLFGEGRDPFVVLIGHSVCFDAVLLLMNLILFVLESFGLHLFHPRLE